MEELSEDEEDLEEKPAFHREIWEIKAKIKKSFKQENKPPASDFSFYKYGKKIGSGPNGTILLGLHKLTRKVVALKNIDIKHH